MAFASTHKPASLTVEDAENFARVFVALVHAIQPQVPSIVSPVTIAALPAHRAIDSANVLPVNTPAEENARTS